MSQRGGCETIHSIVKAYRLYLEHVRLHLDEPVLSLTRAWTLVRFFDSRMLKMAPCTRCRGHFVAHAHDPHQGFVCGLCAPPSRAGKTRKAADAHGGRAQAAVGELSGAAAQALPGGAGASA
jgi:flagellar transcriptional activator FlhC